MLWSDRDRRDEPPEDMRQVQAMLRRAMLVIALTVPLLMLLVGWHS
ncbi:morphogenic membrane protein MmpB [Streptomyces fildesensis]|uniref:Morphogenic membrane protein MmpB n=1 Tax=Streptomyces fildesensis TaxID=375757 RepID=A0ABW8BZP6_9ACTN